MAAAVLTSTIGLSHEDWLRYRRLGIGGSDASIVCGVNKYKSPIELWLEKTGQAPNQEAGEAAYWGTQLEPLVREEFTRRTGIKVLHVNQIIQSRAYPFMLANLDGVCRCPAHGKCVFEAKTASAYKDAEWEGDHIPQEYVLQCQHYLFVTGYNGAYIAVLIGGNSFRWKFIARDESIISMLIRCEQDFWNHVQSGVSLEPDGSNACANFIAKQYPNSISKSKVVLPANAVDLLHQYNTASEQLELITKQKQQASNQLKHMLGEHEIGIIGDSAVKWTTVTQERFNAQMLEKEQPDIYAKYIIQSSHRRFIVKIANNHEGDGKNHKELSKKAG